MMLWLWIFLLGRHHVHAHRWNLDRGALVAHYMVVDQAVGRAIEDLVATVMMARQTIGKAVWIGIMR